MQDVPQGNQRTTKSHAEQLNQRVTASVLTEKLYAISLENGWRMSISRCHRYGRRGAAKYSFAGGDFSKPSLISDTVPVKDLINLSGFFQRQHHPNGLLVLINKDPILRNFAAD
jgi:hypothetical protein